MTDEELIKRLACFLILPICVLVSLATFLSVRMYFQAFSRALQKALDDATAQTARVVLLMAGEHAKGEGKKLYERARAALNEAFPGKNKFTQPDPPSVPANLFQTAFPPPGAACGDSLPEGAS